MMHWIAVAMIIHGFVCFHMIGGTTMISGYGFVEVNFKFIGLV